MILPASCHQDVFRLGESSSGRSGVELGSVQPDAMQDDGELACDGGLGPARADLRAQLKPPSAQRIVMPHPCHQRIRCLKQQAARGTVTGLGDPSRQIDVAGLVAPWCQPKKSADIARAPEAFWVVDGGQEGQGRDRRLASISVSPVISTSRTNAVDETLNPLLVDAALPS
jgi:hypothetical protein